MRVILAGSRKGATIGDVEQAMQEAWDAGIEPDVILCGMARGVDLLGRAYAMARGIAVEEYPAEWNRLGLKAGPERNRLMAEKAGPGGALVALWDGQSPGTRHMIAVARVAGLRVRVYRLDELSP